MSAVPDWFAKGLLVLFAGFNREASALVVASYWEALRDIPRADIEASLRKSLRSGGDFPPTAPHLRTLAGSLRAYPPALPPLPVKPWTTEQIAEAERMRAGNQYLAATHAPGEPR